MFKYRTMALAWLIVFSCAVVVEANASSINELSLSKAITIALSQNKTLSNQYASLDRVGLSINRADAEFDLTFHPDASASYNNLAGSENNIGVITKKKFRNGAELISRLGGQQFDEEDTAVFKLELSQPLLRNRGEFINTLPVTEAEQGYLSAQRDYHAARSRLAMDVIQSYLELVKLERQRLADEKSVQRAESNLSATRARESLGWTTRIDRLRVEGQLGNARQQLTTTTKQKQSEQSILSELLGLDNEVAVPPLSQNIPSPRTGLNTDPKSLYRTALANRLDLAVLTQGYSDAQRNVEVAVHRMRPELRFVARFEQADSRIFFDGELGNRQRWLIGFSTDTGFNRRRSSIEHQQAVNTELTSQNAITTLRQHIQLEIDEALKQIKLIENRIELAKQNFAQASNRLRLAQRLFELGREPQITVSDAEESFTRDQQLLIQAQTDLLLAQYRLVFVAGTLLDVPLELKPDTRLLVREALIKS